MNEDIRRYLRVKHFLFYVQSHCINNYALVDGSIVAAMQHDEGYFHTYLWLHKHTAWSLSCAIAYRYYKEHC